MTNPIRELCDGVVEQLKTVPDIGHVHRRAAYIPSLSAWLDAVKFTDSDDNVVLRAWVVEPGSPSVATDVSGMGVNVAVGHEFTVKVTGFQAVDKATPEEEGAFDQLLELAWLAKRKLDRWQPDDPTALTGIMLPTACRIGQVTTRILPTGSLVWAVELQRTFQFSEDSFELDPG